MSKDNKEFFKTKNHWSEIKDQLLDGYLTPYFQKLLATGKPIFYVDCFAGKGRFGDGKPGSPLIALQARDLCLDRTRIQNASDKLNICFIDLNYAQELTSNISEFNNQYGEKNVIAGRYEDKIEGLLKYKRGFNVFLYIDPYGIQALDSALFDKFEAYRFNTLEILINFNSFGFFRDACRVMSVQYKDDDALCDLDDLVEYEPAKVSSSKQSGELLTKIAGGEYWQDIVTSYKKKEIDGYKAERRLSTEYKQRLQQKYGYVLDMPIRLRPGQRPKYRMIHVCSHEDGCLLMAHNMQKRKNELFIDVQQGGQYSLFDCIPTMTASHDIKIKIKEYLESICNDISITKFIAGFVNAHGLICDFSMIHEILNELEKDKIINIIRNPSKTKTGNSTTFWEENKNNKLTIRRTRR